MSIPYIILTSVIVFLVAVLIPVAILIIVKKRLTPKGDVKISINDERELEVKPGNSLLQTLAEEQIFLPSACGGKGNCGMCNVRFLKAVALSYRLKKAFSVIKNSSTTGD